MRVGAIVPGWTANLWSNPDVSGGHDELMYGLQRAEAARDEGEARGQELVGQWARALDRYASLY
jgi:hypothetical protein